jgi:RND family efflux transporter MFP subunit
MKSGSKTILTVILTAVAVALGFRIADGIQARTHAEAALVRETDRAAILSVNVVHPSLGAQSQELILPGNIQAFTDTPVYARTNGYLKRWYVDIGARVKSGQLLAEIETPEVDQQLRQARAELGTAEANLQLSNSTAERWQDLLKTESVSRQETDEKIGDLAAKKALVDAASANVKRLEETQSFQKIYAPFDGVITARSIDIGSLVTAGSAGPKELYHMGAINQMRVYVQVPEMNSRAATPGLPADLTLSELPGRRFHARVVRTSESIDQSSRTLLAEVDVENPGSLLLPGAYVEVHLKLPTPAHSVTVPVNALLFRSEGLNVAVARNGVVALVPIAVGHDYGNSLEVTSGLSPSERLIINPPDSIVAGQKVQIVAASQGNPQ